MAALSSAKHSAPQVARRPDRIQTSRLSPGAPTSRATILGARKIPEPTIPPTTIDVAWEGPKTRTSCTPTVVEAGSDGSVLPLLCGLECKVANSFNLQLSNDI